MAQNNSAWLQKDFTNVGRRRIRLRARRAAWLSWAKSFAPEVGQLMLLAVTPDVFDRIEFRRVGRQKLQSDLPCLGEDVVTHQPAAMDWQPIPDDGQSASDVSLQVLEELDHLWSLDAPGEKAEVKVPNRNPGHGRKALPVEGVLQHRRLAARSPGAHPMGPFAQSALVHKDYGAPLLEGFFFISGQRTRFHFRMAASSRWVARPTGRWQLQPKERKIRHTCPG